MPAAALLAVSLCLAQPAVDPLTPVPFTAVRFTDDFWAPKLEVIHEKTTWANFHQCEETGRIENLRRAGTGGGEYQGYFFNDSDVYKAIEGAAYQLALKPDPKLDAYLDDLIATIAAAQQPDGYINSYFTIKEGLDKRWTNEADKHETYCMGHLIEAGIAHFQATGKRSLLDVAIKAADHHCATFGPGKRAEAPGHQEIELALVKLSRVTGDKKYFDLAAFFLECRGKPRPTAKAPQGEIYGEYCQDHLPIREQTTVVGHAVRAMYLYSAVADVAAVTRDAGYIDAMHSVWDDLAYKKVYITGGIGPSAHNEGFTVAYDLPNDSAYAETCAAIGMALWAHRLNLLHADAKYFDAFERSLYNGLLSGVSLDGTKFFYVNPLTSVGKHHRQDWYACACCPPNVLRFFSSLGGYAYATRGKEIFVNLYAGGSAEIALDGGSVSVHQETKYPWDAKVRLTFNPTPLLKDAAVNLRIPAWCRGASWSSDGKTVKPAGPGYARIALKEGQTTAIELDLPMPVERVLAHPSVKSNAGRCALQRGPVVYCLEQADNSGGVLNFVLPAGAEIRAELRPAMLGGISVLRGTGLQVEQRKWDADTLYAAGPDAKSAEFTAIPYYAWDNRKPGEMTVWLPESVQSLVLAPETDESASASHCWKTDSPAAICDGKVPSSSADQSIPRLTFWPRKGTTEWAQIDFRKPRPVSAVQAYFFDDTKAGGGCKLPTAWRVLYLDGKEWKPVDAKSAGPVKLNTANAITFTPVRTSAIRVELDLARDFSAGLLELSVER